jgi:RNAse (barnase) inhibitor barstar
MATEKPTYVIDGAAFDDIDGFYDEIGRHLLKGQPWGRNLDAFDDILRGDFGPLPAEFNLVWEHADLSRRRLGDQGDGSFGELLQIITDHPNVELVLS